MIQKYTVLFFIVGTHLMTVRAEFAEVISTCRIVTAARKITRKPIYTIVERSSISSCFLELSARPYFF